MERIIITISMLLTWGVTTWISVKALVAFIPDCGFIIYILGIALESGKAVFVIYIHRKWKTSNIITKSFYSSVIIILISLTACEVLGFLSNGHLKSSQSNYKIDAELKGINLEKNLLENQIKIIENNLKDFPDGYGSKKLEVRRKSQLDDKIDRLQQLLTRETELSKTQFSKNNLEPVFATSKLLKVKKETAAPIFIIIIVVVLELLSLGLTIAVSNLWQQKETVSGFGNHKLKNDSEKEIKAQLSTDIQNEKDEIQVLNYFNDAGSELYKFFNYLVVKFNLSSDTIMEITEKSKSKTVDSWLNGDSEIPLKELYKIMNYVDSNRNDLLCN